MEFYHINLSGGIKLYFQIFCGKTYSVHLLKVNYVLFIILFHISFKSVSIQIMSSCVLQNGVIVMNPFS